MGREDDINNKELVPSDSRELIRQKAVSCVNCGTTFNKDKVFCPSCGLGVQDMLLPSEQVYTAEITGRGAASRSARIFALLSLILGIAGPLALGIGWLLAIVFGFTALNLLRSRGGILGDKKLAVWGISLGFFWPLAFFLGFSFYSYRSLTERTIARNESAVQEAFVQIGVAQRYLKSGYFIEGEDSESEYAGKEALLEIQHGFDVPDISAGEKFGYDIAMGFAGAGGFELRAHPSRYGVTGRRSFFMDETGILRGGDVGGDRDFSRWRTLSAMRESPVFSDYEDEIARSLAGLVRTLADKMEVERAERVISEIRNNYYMTPAASRLDSLEAGLERRAYESAAVLSYREIEAKIEDGDYRTALSRLKTLTENFPESSVAPEAEKRISEVQRVIAGELENEARGLLEEARGFEAEGEYDRALANYRKILRELDSTPQVKEAESYAAALEKRVAEKRAGELFAEITSLKPAESFARIISAVNTLLSRFQETELVGNNRSRLESIRDAAVGQREKKNAENAFENENYSAAIQAGEAAVKADPSLEEELNPILRESYRNRAENLFANRSFEQAAGYYEKWMGLADYRETEEHQNYLESVFQIARQTYYSGDWDSARKSISDLGRGYTHKAEFWYISGSIAAADGEYGEAVPMFERALAIDESHGPAWKKKALCRIIMLQEKEEEAVALMKQLIPSPRGTDLVFRSNNLLRSLNTKHEEMRHIAAGTSMADAHVRRRRQLPVERESFGADTRSKMFDIEDIYLKNEGLRRRILSLLSEIRDDYSKIHSNMRLAVLYKEEEGALARPFADKRSKASEYTTRLTSALNSEGVIETNALSTLRSALSRFIDDSDFDKESRDMSRLVESLGRMRIKTDFEEGYAALQSSASTKIEALEYLQTVK